VLRASTCLANIVTHHLALDAREAYQHGRLPAPDGLRNALQIARGKTESSELLTDSGPRFILGSAQRSSLASFVQQRAAGQRNFGIIAAMLDRSHPHIPVHEARGSCLGEDAWIKFRTREQLFVADCGRESWLEASSEW